MPRQLLQFTAPAIIMVLIGLAGCGAPEQAATSTVPSTAGPVASSKSAAAATSENSATSADNGDQASDQAYEPPFSGRIEAFQPPSNARRAARSQQSGERYESAVELIGFANLGQPLALLAIDGVMTPIALGTERNGVQVISIQARSAVLQRGRNRWTATLE